eukprot:TRINITY_DN1728_c0_g1_i6.p1 TRINITY_DN1728_c0_g1~~TRINITY_DN1728_c0_g1_i6.p1  ORF type:complete len:781 (+),score=46.38 TRINITY_DN1728_c0_g1_i6:234-2345(+)
MNVRHQNIQGQKSHVATLRYLREYLWDVVDGEMSRAEWNKAFDCKAPGIRSAYSVKMKDSEIVSRDMYIPLAPFPTRQSAIIGCSMFLPATGRWNDTTREAIMLESDKMLDEEMERYVASELNADLTIPIDGIPTVVDQELVDLFIKCLPAYLSRGRCWGLVINRVKHAAELCGFFNPAYLLHEWSKQTAEEYNERENEAKYAAVRVNELEVGVAITWLRNQALKGNRVAVLEHVHPVPPIFSQSDAYFSGYLKYCREYANREEMMATAGGFIRRTVAYIINGGNPFYITKNLRDGHIVYDFANGLARVRDPISWTVTNGKSQKMVSVKFIELIQSMHGEISFDRVDFIPRSPSEPADYSNGIFNMWTGYKARLLDTDDFSQIEPLISHIRDVLACGREDLMDYIVNWMAHLVQKPRQKIGTALVFQSEQGAGKNILTDFLVGNVIGQKSAVTVNDLEQLTGRFNVIMENKLLTVCDEVGNYGGCYKTNDKLKSLITQSEQNIERKGIDTITVHDYNNYIMQSNNAWSVRVEASDRRYVVIGCSEKRIGDHAYFRELVEVRESPGSADLFLTWLHSRDISEWNPRVIPNTELRQEMKIRALDFPIQYMLHLLGGHDNRVEFGEDCKLTMSIMYMGFTEWARNNGAFGKFTERSFSLAVNKIIKTKVLRVDGKTVRGYDLDKPVWTAAICAHLRMNEEELAGYL